jgi:hypothetical protein
MKAALAALMLLLALSACATGPHQGNDGSLTLTTEQQDNLESNIRKLLHIIDFQSVIIRQQQKKIDELERGGRT